VREEVAARCQGKTAALFVGGSRAHHYQDLFKDMDSRFAFLVSATGVSHRFPATVPKSRKAFICAPFCIDSYHQSTDSPA
jgi:nitrogenase molybdenum-iron protein alpha/beta subunit